MPSTRTIVRHLLPRGLRNWIRAPSRSARWIYDEVRHVLGAHPVLKLPPGWSLRCHPVAYRAIQAAQIGDRDQAAELHEFVRACVPGMVFLDLGAHFGVFSFAALHHGGEHARAFAVEPSPAATRIMAIMARLNGVAGRLSIRQAAVAEGEGTLRMLALGVIADGYFAHASEQRPRSEYTTVPTVSGDSLLRELGVRPTHVKIDVEGAEAAVLRGGRALFDGSPRPQIFIELHNAMARAEGRDPAEVLHLLAAYGYDTLTVAGEPSSARTLTGPGVVRAVATASISGA